MSDAAALIAAAFLMGLTGAGHCVGMCGGIASALALRAPGVGGALLQHAGRLTAYLSLGLAAGALGALGAAHPALAQAVQVLRAVAVAVVFAVGMALVADRRPWDGPARVGMALWRLSVGRLVGSAGAAGWPRALAMGFAWGLLPCGLSWSAVTATLGAGAATGALALLAFGIGTLPGTLPFSLAGWRVQAWLTRPATRRVAGVALIGLALVMAWLLWPAPSAAHHH